MSGRLQEHDEECIDAHDGNSEFIDTIIDPIPVFGPLLADLFYTWSGLADAMNLRRLADGSRAVAAR